MDAESLEGNAQDKFHHHDSRHLGHDWLSILEEVQAFAVYSLLRATSSHSI